MSNSSKDDIVNIFKIIWLKVGLRANNFPDEDIELPVIIDHLLKNYGNHTTAEILLAFDMAVLGKLDLSEKEVTCYENFSCLYFSKIMTAYRHWAKDVHRQLKPPPVLLDDKKELTRDEMMDWVKEWQETPVISFDMIPVVFYDFLIKENEIDISSSQKWEYTDKAAKQVKALLVEELSVNANATNNQRLRLFTEMEVSGFKGEFKATIINRAKKLILMDYFNKLKEIDNF